MGNRAGKGSVITRAQIIGALKRCSSKDECIFCKHPSIVVRHMLHICAENAALIHSIGEC